LGYAVLYKRLHRATTRPPKPPEPSMRALELDIKSLAALMRGVDRAPRGSTRIRP
jgi:transposase